MSLTTREHSEVLLAYWLTEAPAWHLDEKRRELIASIELLKIRERSLEPGPMRAEVAKEREMVTRALLLLHEAARRQIASSGEGDL